MAGALTSRAGSPDRPAAGAPTAQPDPAGPATADDAESAIDLGSLSTATNRVNAPGPIPPVSAAPPLEDLRPGARLAQYRLLRQLGAGGMGTVFEAEDEWLTRRVALKVLRTELPADKDARARFLREARSMAAVEHENVCTVYQVGEADGRSFMAMQLLAGETLEARLERERRLTVAEAARIGREIATGLAAAHAKGLVHRDVKPSNIWLEAGTGRVKLLDFGLAQARDHTHLTHVGFVIGTPAFMSPEQARGEPLDPRSDLFSLGVVLYLATTGERPFDGPTAMAVMRSLELHCPVRANVKRADVPAAFSNLIMELLAKDRKDRPLSADLVAARLARPEMIRPSHLPVAPPPSLAGPAAPAGPRDSGWQPAPRGQSPCTAGVRFLFRLAAAAVIVGTFWYFYVANYGKLVVESQAFDAEVLVRQNGQIRQALTFPRDADLRPGTYELTLTKPSSGYKLTRTTVRIGRGGRETVGIVPNVPGK